MTPLHIEVTSLVMRSSRGLTAPLVSGGLQCSFLYQTRTILGQQRGLHKERTKTSVENASTRSRPLDRRTEDENSQESRSTSFLKQKAAQVAPGRTKFGPTVTAAEKAAFDSIWALFEKPSPSNPQKRATSIDHTDTDYKNILELFSPPPEPLKSHSSSSHEVLNDSVEQKHFKPQSPAKSEATSPTSKSFAVVQPSESQVKLNREGAMAEIQNFLKDTASSPETFSSSTSRSTQEIHAAALNIVEDVADSLTTALSAQDLRPDIAMWKVAEQKIFPLIKLLRPSTTSLSSPMPPAPDSTSGSLSKIQSNPQTPVTSHPLVPSDVPLLPLLSLAYPSLTLLILRLYTTHLPTSPYVLALLPTLKSLGPTSYVLGAHTHFYNTLLSLHWKIYSDLRGMSTLLTEMEANGVEFDIGTWEAIKAIAEDRELDLEARGQRGELWWDRIEQRVWWQRVGIEWREIVKRRLEKKGLSTGEVMREGRVGSGMESHPREAEYVVTL